MNNNLIKYHPYSSQAQSQNSLSRVKNLQDRENQKIKNKSILKKPISASNRTNQNNKENSKLDLRNNNSNKINANYEYQNYINSNNQLQGKIS